MKITKGQLRRLIRENISSMLLENEQNARYEKLLSLLDSHDLDNVMLGIDLAESMGLAEVVKHVARKGGSRGFKGVQRIITLKLAQPFMEFFFQVFDENRGMSPNRNVFLQHDFGSIRTIEIVADDGIETWAEVSGGDRTAHEVEMPI